MQEVLKFILDLLIKYIKIIINIPKISETQAIFAFISTGGIATIIGILALIKKTRK